MSGLCKTCTTPVKKHKPTTLDNLGSRRIESPYFSPSKRQGLSALSTASPTSTCASEELSSYSEIPENNLESLHPNDPLIHFYSYTFSRMYRALEDLKPSLIQGMSATAESSSWVLEPTWRTERVAGDVWKLLVAVTLLNKTSSKLAIPLFWVLLERWPTPLALSQASEIELSTMLKKIGTQTVRSKRLIQLFKEYLQDAPSVYDLRPSRPASTITAPTHSTRSRHKVRGRYPPTPISHLPGTGPYALDSYRIFCTLHDDPGSTEWQKVMPGDKELIRYLRWRWAFVQHSQWSSITGVGPPVTMSYLRRLLWELKTSSV